jgi:hypothetical protein
MLKPKEMQLSSSPLSPSIFMVMVYDPCNGTNANERESTNNSTCRRYAICQY